MTAMAMVLFWLCGRVTSQNIPKHPIPSGLLICYCGCVDVLSYSSGGQKSKMDLRELQQSIVRASIPSGGSREESISCSVQLVSAVCVPVCSSSISRERNLKDSASYVITSALSLLSSLFLTKTFVLGLT